MPEMSKIVVMDQDGNVKRELMAEGYVICALTDEREFGEGIRAKKNATVAAENVSVAEIAAAMMNEETPLGEAHKLLNEIAKKKSRMKSLLARFGKD